MTSSTSVGQYDGTVGEIPFVAFDEHLVVGVARNPSELCACLGNVEVDGSTVHRCVIGSQGRDSQTRGELHGRDHGPHRQRLDLRPCTRMVAEMLQHLAHRPEPVRAAIEGVGALQGAGQNTGCGQVLRVDELVDVFAVIEYGDVLSLVNPLEEDLKNSKPAVTQDGAGPDD